MDESDQKQQEVFKPLGPSVKAAVIMSGASVVDLDMLCNSLSEGQIKALKAITSDPSHPWMIEHRERVKGLQVESQRKFRTKLDRERRLKKAVDKVYWQRKTARQKAIAILLSGFQKMFLIGVSLLGALLGLSFAFNGF